MPPRLSWGKRATRSSPPPTLRRMDLRLSTADRDLRQKARDFTDQVLVPLEDECEENGGLTPESAAAAKQAVLDWDFHAINHAEDRRRPGP